MLYSGDELYVRHELVPGATEGVHVDQLLVNNLQLLNKYINVYLVSSDIPVYTILFPCFVILVDDVSRWLFYFLVPWGKLTPEDHKDFWEFFVKKNSCLFLHRLLCIPKDDRVAYNDF